MKRIFLSFLLIFIAVLSFAQSGANIKVDELSDAQILQIVKQAEAMGYTTEAQLEQAAAAKGIKKEEMVKFKARVEKLKKQGAGSQTTDKPSSGTGREYSETTDGGAINNEKKEDDGEIQSKIFGSDLFRNGNITFEPNLRIATPKSYIIGPDDKLIIDLTGDNERTYNLQVSPEGVINLEYVGRISVGGLSIDQAASKIKSTMAKTYPALRSGRTSVAVNLGNIRSIQVTITGQVVKAGTYTLPSLANVYRALYMSGGPSQNGTFRNIQVIRNNKIVANVDVYDFLLRGIQQGNIRLQDQDVINIPAYDKRVEISGEVKDAAIFEVKNNETLQDVINFAKGFTADAYTAKIKSFQNTDRERRISDISESQYNTYQPKNGDKFIVEAILERFENRVEIIGAVFRPGVYSLDNGLTLKGLIQKADGITEDAFLNRGYINRLNPDKTQYIVSFDVAKILSGEEKDIPLTREDKVTISSIFDLREEYTVTIQGEVRAPGTFEYSQNLKLEDIIQMAGGLKEGATPNRIEVSRRIKNSDPTSTSSKTADLFVVNIDENLRVVGDKFEIKPFDIISVRNSEGYSVQKQVKIEGEVLYPGMYTITSKDYRISDLIKRAGGLTSFAYAEGASLKRPGAEKINPADKNAINNKDEEDKKFANLERLQEKDAKDTGAVKKVKEELVQSDLVGINLEKILKKPLSRQDLILEEGDVVRVPKQLQTVKVTGEVLNPNSIVYVPGKSFKQYINGAGGFTNSALKNRAYIKYANGSAEAAKKFLFFNNYPKVRPGAEIFVPVKAEREKMSAQAWVGIGTGVASLAAIIVSLFR
ncbi:SLBB domain-containing protein [Pedobacter chitinilyticus]|uniref:Capsule biosynthesis protein n=1 Tax=Pedobacter chitinilyticus TaxID=2233776 RepID=A0A3S3PST7_9SPHI|nr:SLBB domain-containing protein [Pedobacter chitinilyticus]RWU05451.1 capsule biosynthesis protein [Pedobacter chitinilyticus]